MGRHVGAPSETDRRTDGQRQRQRERERERETGGGVDKRQSEQEQSYLFSIVKPDFLGVNALLG